MKKNKPQNRPQPAQITAVRRCLENGEFAITKAAEDLPGLMRLNTMLRDGQERFV